MKLAPDWLQDPLSQKLLQTFESSGFQTLFVGGCVRNTILKRPVADLDIATSAPPDVSEKLAKKAGFKVIPTGVEHGTITAVSQGKSFEITSFRKDIETFGRRAVVSFSDNIQDDALRRDFTMNALYLDLYGAVIDPLKGMDDALAGIVRFIENPDQRIKEDFLRILRFFRFHAWYGNPIHGTNIDAIAAIGQNVDGLQHISKERIGSEIRKLLSAVDPTPAVSAMEHTGVLRAVLPGATSKQLGPLVHLEQQFNLGTDWMRRLISLGGSDLKQALRLSNTEARRHKQFQKAAGSGFGTDEIAYRFGRETAIDVTLNTSAVLGAFPQNDFVQKIEDASRKVFPVSAADLPESLVGPQIGTRLKQLETAWIASGFTASKSDLLAS